MIRNYFKIAFRNLRKNGTLSFINIFGLTIGLSCCLLIGLYIQHELSYDDFQKKGARIARVIMEYGTGDEVSKGNYTSTKVAPAFKKNFPEVEAGIRMFQGNKITAYGDKLFSEKRFLYADSNFFDIFSFQLLKGNSNQVLSAPNMLVITESMAKKYFGNDDPIGKIMKITGNAVNYQVTGVMEDCPSNSQLKFDFLASFSSLGPAQEETYWNANFTTYLLLKDESSIATLQSKILPFMQKEMASENVHLNFILEPFKKIHLYSPYEGFEPNNSIIYIYVISGIALLILAIACFTYINLSTARSIERAREVGIRKVIGAFKSQVFWQFISESVVLTLISLLFSIVVVVLAMPAFNTLAEKSLSVASLLTAPVLAFTLFIITCISLLAGSYPAVILSGFKPVKVLKGSFKNSERGLGVRKSLIVFQFIISVFLIVSTFIIQRQLQYIQDKKLGYDREHVLILPMDQKIYDKIGTIKTEFKTNNNIVGVSAAYNAPNHILGGYNMSRPGMGSGQQIMVKANPIDEDFIRTSGIQIIAGADLSEQDVTNISYEEGKSDIFQFILNETAARVMGWKPEEAVGKKMSLGDQRSGFVKGVIKDFHFESLHNPIGPLVLFPDKYGNTMMVKVSGNDLPQTISFLQSKWKGLVTHRPFEYHFLDEDYNKMYSAELRVGKVLNVFSGIAILLACLGLFGLSSYAAQQRVKEIGVRKILGASIGNIIAILSKDFIKLALIATIIAFPIAWLVMHKWLQDFTYRITISWWIFAVSLVAILLITILTVSFQAVKTALANPVKSLRTE